MKYYIAGPITGNPNYKEDFARAERSCQSHGHTVMNPAVLAEGFEQKEYMHICRAMIDVCDTVFFMPGWRNSEGAKLEHAYAVAKDKNLCYQSEWFEEDYQDSSRRAELMSIYYDEGETKVDLCGVLEPYLTEDVTDKLITKLSEVTEILESAIEEKEV